MPRLEGPGRVGPRRHQRFLGVPKNDLFFLDRSNCFAQTNVSCSFWMALVNAGRVRIQYEAEHPGSWFYRLFAFHSKPKLVLGTPDPLWRPRRLWAWEMRIPKGPSKRQLPRTFGRFVIIAGAESALAQQTRDLSSAPKYTWGGFVYFPVLDSPFSVGFLLRKMSGRRDVDRGAEEPQQVCPRVRTRARILLAPHVAIFRIEPRLSILKESPKQSRRYYIHFIFSGDRLILISISINWR